MMSNLNPDASSGLEYWKLSKTGGSRPKYIMARVRMCWGDICWTSSISFSGAKSLVTWKENILCISNYSHLLMTVHFDQATRIHTSIDLYSFHTRKSLKYFKTKNFFLKILFNLGTRNVIDLLLLMRRQINHDLAGWWVFISNVTKILSIFLWFIHLSVSQDIMWWLSNGEIHI